MIMKQKKNQLTEKQNAKGIVRYSIIILSFLIPVAMVALKGVLRHETTEQIVQGLIITGLFSFLVLGKAVCYSAQESFYRCLLCSYAVCVLCYFLPIAGWPYGLVYIIFTLYTSTLDACIYPSLLLVILSFLKASGNEADWLAYFFLGMVVCILFTKWKEEKNTNYSIAVFCCCFLICQCVFHVLSHGIRIDLERLIILIANLLITLILYVVILKEYLKNILERYADTYSILNEPTNPLLEQFKEVQPREYMLRIHTAYFCERIAGQIGVSPEPIRCATLYLSMQDKADFPPKVRQIWEEYEQNTRGLITTDTLILIASEKVVTALSLYIDKHGKKENYQTEIDTILTLMEKKQICYQSNVTYRDWQMIKKVFLEEKLYYDFLCGK